MTWPPWFREDWWAVYGDLDLTNRWVRLEDRAAGSPVVALAGRRKGAVQIASALYEPGHGHNVPGPRRRTAFGAAGRKREDGMKQSSPASAITAETLANALDAGRRRLARAFTATAVRYDPARDAVDIDLSQGFGLRLPRTAIAELATVPIGALTALELSPAGTGIDLDDHNVHINVHGLVLSLLSPSTLAASLGKRGGAQSTAAKRESARANGRLGGRPKKPPRAA